MNYIGLAFGLLFSAMLLRLAIALWRYETKPRQNYPGGYYSRQRHRIEISRTALSGEGK